MSLESGLSNAHRARGAYHQGRRRQTNDKDNTKAIKDAEDNIDIVTFNIEEMTAWDAQLATVTKNLEKEIAKHQDSLDKDTSIRKEKLAEFNVAEKDFPEADGGAEGCYHSAVEAPRRPAAAGAR